jgi:glyoxalase family protein
LERILGFKPSGEYRAENDPKRKTVVFSAGQGGPGTEVHVEYGPHLIPNQLGHGGVHHVAFSTPNDEEQIAWRQRIASSGLGVTPVIDRFYFKSIYFREPGGILYEIATEGPGFTTDEDFENLGEGLALPPFLESRRESIEASLKPL